jgi:hypothetical protein
MRHLDAELRHEKLKVTPKTVIIVNDSMRKNPLFPLFEQEIKKRGGKIVHAGEMIRERVIQELRAEQAELAVETLREKLKHENDSRKVKEVIKQPQGITIPLKL